MSTSTSLPRLWLRLLTFRATVADYESLGRGHLIAGLIVCWLVGIGRYWDDTRANLLQHSGLGSVVYVFVLAAVMWTIVHPVVPARFSYARILTFITLTSPPAALYAIPVEKWMTLESANLLNLYFLGVVALWRLALWIHYLHRFGALRIWEVLCVAFMPLAIIFITLTALNLHHVVLDIMGGIREADKTSHDAAYELLFGLSVLSVPVSICAAAGWIVMMAQHKPRRYKPRRRRPRRRTAAMKRMRQDRLAKSNASSSASTDQSSSPDAPNDRSLPR